MLNNVSLNLREQDERRSFVDRAIDMPNQSEYQVEYIGDNRKIKDIISLLLLKQGGIPIETIEQAINECIASLQMALPASTNIEPLKSWITPNKRLIGRLWIFTKAHNTQEEMITELLDSYDRRRQACVKGTIERLVETTHIGPILNVLDDAPLPYDGYDGMMAASRHRQHS